MFLVSDAHQLDLVALLGSECLSEAMPHRLMRLQILLTGNPVGQGFKPGVEKEDPVTSGMTT